MNSEKLDKIALQYLFNDQKKKLIFLSKKEEQLQKINRKCDLIIINKESHEADIVLLNEVWSLFL